jgi:hypothetical protein
VLRPALDGTPTHGTIIGTCPDFHRSSSPKWQRALKRTLTAVRLLSNLAAWLKAAKTPILPPNMTVRIGNHSAIGCALLSA